MSEDRQTVDRDIEETLGLVPEFFESVPGGSDREDVLASALDPRLS